MQAPPGEPDAFIDNAVPLSLLFACYGSHSRSPCRISSWVGLSFVDSGDYCAICLVSPARCTRCMYVAFMLYIMYRYVSVTLGLLAGNKMHAVLLYDSPFMKQILILNLQCEGSKKPHKRRKAFDYLKKQKVYDIMLQETHRSDEKGTNSWSREWGHGPSFWNCYKSNSRDTAILISTSSDASIKVKDV